MDAQPKQIQEQLQAERQRSENERRLCEHAEDSAEQGINVRGRIANVVMRRSKRVVQPLRKSGVMPLSLRVHFGPDRQVLECARVYSQPGKQT